MIHTHDIVPTRITARSHWFVFLLASFPACSRSQVAVGQGSRAETAVVTPRYRPAATETGSREADLVLVNGRVFTADPHLPWAEAIAIRGEYLSAVGSNDEVRRLQGAKTKTVDLGGKVVIPGINDAHLHEPRVWHRVDVDARGVQSADALIDRVAAEAAKYPAGTWLHAGDLPPSFIDDPKLQRVRLDAKIPGHPVLLVLLGDHAACLNSAALAAWHINQDSKPGRGSYRRDGSGRLNGWVQEYALWKNYAPTATVSDDGIADALAEFARTALALGITSVQAMPLQVPSERVARVLSKRGTPLRWRLIRFPMNEIEELSPGTASPPPESNARLDGIKYILDGTPLERGAAMRAGYRDRPIERGQLNFSEQEFARILVESTTSGVPLLLHVAGDATAEFALRSMEREGGLASWSTRRVRFEHGDGTFPFLDLMKQAGIVVVQNPTHFAPLPEISMRLSPEQRKTSQPLKSLLAAGVPVALGSDGALNPFLNIMFASIHPLNPAEAITREQAVIAYTRGSAYAEFAENVKGTLARGMLADVAVLSQDIFSVPIDQLPRTESALTILGGKIVHSSAQKAHEAAAQRVTRQQ
jgi:predicted amidohydrolase YtcJ